MSTQTNAHPVRYVKQTPDGDVYVVPESEEFAFTLAVEEIQNAEWGSSEWMQLNYDFTINFDQYRVKDE